MITSSLFVAIILSFFSILFWIVVFYFISERYTTPWSFLLKALGVGSLAAFLAAFLERKVLMPELLSGDLLLIFEQTRTIQNFQELIIIFGIILFLIAIPEELIKFLIFKRVAYPSKDFNQVMDGIKFGLFLGLGFAFIENAYYFARELGPQADISYTGSLFYLFLLRFFISTLAHAIYGGIMGYFFALSKFYRIFYYIFLWQGFIVAVFAHLIFNFLILLYPLNFFVTFFLVALLYLIFRWYSDRRNFQVFLTSGKPIKKPIFLQPGELQALIYGQKIPYSLDLIEKLQICPFCLNPVGPRETICQSCGRETKEPPNISKGA